MQLQDKVVILTGGGTGIGRAAALLFAERGARVVVCGRRAEMLVETVRLIEERGGHALAVPTNVKNWMRVSRMVSAVLGKFGRVDILVNNAGVAIAKPLVEMREEEWDEMIGTNLKGIFLCCKAVLPSMVEASSGVIVNVSSILGNSGIANFGAYCASKFGVIGLTQALADELGSRGIRIYAVCPGRTSTDMQRQLGGEMIAELSMPPRKVAEKIVGLVSGEVRLPLGGTLVVDEQSWRLGFYEAKHKWLQATRQWLNPFPALRRMKGLMQ